MDLGKLTETVFDLDLVELLKDLPDLELDIIRDDYDLDKKIEKKETSKLLKNLNVKKLTECDFNKDEALSAFVKSELLKVTPQHSEEFSDNYFHILDKDNNFKDILEILFWLVHNIKFFPVEKKAVTILRTRLSEVYPYFFERLPEPKNEMLTILQFTLGYIINAFHYRLFPDHRNLHTVRFTLDCFHVVIFILTGVFVSDYYIHSSLEKYFGRKFFYYQQTHWGKTVEENVVDPKEQNSERNFFSRDIQVMKKTSEDENINLINGMKNLATIESVEVIPESIVEAPRQERFTQGGRRSSICEKIIPKKESSHNVLQKKESLNNVIHKKASIITPSHQPPLISQSEPPNSSFFNNQSSIKNKQSFPNQYKSSLSTHQRAVSEVPSYQIEDMNNRKEFGRALSSKFSKLQKIGTGKSAMIYNRLQNEMFVSLNDLAKDANCNDILITRAKNKESILREKEMIKNNMLYNNNSVSLQETSTMNTKNNNQSGIYQHPSNTNLNDMSILKPKEESKREKVTNSLPSINKKYYFDCAQISPGLANYTDNNLPIRDTIKISQSSYHIPDACPTKISENYDLLVKNSSFKKLNHEIFQPNKKKITDFLNKQKSRAQHKKLALSKSITESLLHPRGIHSKVTELEQYKFSNQEFDSIKNKFKDFYILRNTLEAKENTQVSTYKKQEDCKILTDKYPGYEKMVDHWDKHFKDQETKAIMQEQKRLKAQNFLEPTIESPKSIRRRCLIISEGSKASDDVKLKLQGNNSFVILPKEVPSVLPSEDLTKLDPFLIEMNNTKENVLEIPDQPKPKGNAYMQSLFEKKDKVIRKKKWGEVGKTKIEHRNQVYRIQDNGDIKYFNNNKFYKKQFIDVLGQEPDFHQDKHNKTFKKN